jgi:HAD superfamily hydrolase (TIGR01509 family)
MDAVLFDLDGTLIDTWRLYVAAYGRTLEPHLGHAPGIAEIARLKPTSEYRLLSNALGEAQAPAAHREFIAHYGALHETYCDGLYPGVPELLAALRAEGRRLGLVTGKTRPAWEITQSRCALGPFEVVVTDEDVRTPKPHPEGLLLAARRLALAPARCLYVGDSLADLGAAREAGMAFAAVLWCKGPGERDAFRAQALEQGARACLERPRELAGLLDDEPATPAAAG